MSRTISSQRDEFSSSIAHCSLSTFVDKAKQVLEQGHGVISYAVGPNEKIGEIFARAVVDVALASQIKSVEKRHGISLAQISAQVKYLRAQDILAFASGILNPSRDTFEELSSSRYSYSDLRQEEQKAKIAQEHFASSAFQKEEIAQKIADINVENYQRLITPETVKGLIIDKLSQQLAKQTLDIDQLQEVLAKLFGTSALKEGMRIPLPCLKVPMTDQVIVKTGFYQVHKTISKEGLMAFALKPVDAPDFIKPMILFRPTVFSTGEQNALKTIAEDMHDEVGKYGFDAAKKDLEALLMDPSFIQPNQKGWVSGFSLGGAHAARLLAFAPDKFSKAFFFNDPSTETKVAVEFASKLLQSTHSKQEPLDIRIFHNEQDDVTLAGSCHVGYIPDTFRAKQRARELCRVSYVKVNTRMAHELSAENISSLAQVEPNIKNILSLTKRVNRQAAMEFAKAKKTIHCQIVLSSFNQGAFSDAQKVHSPRSATVIEQRKVELEHLDKSHCPLAQRFNQKRLSVHGRMIRAIIRVSCRKFAELKNIIARCKNIIKKAFGNVYSPKEVSYTTLIEEKKQKLKDTVWTLDLAEMLSVPKALNPQAPVSGIDVQDLITTILSVPASSR